MPKRIQRKRTKGWKMPPNTVYVGRPTKWGNPYRLGWEDGGYTPMRALDMFKIYVSDLESASLRRQIKTYLRGKNLACWCQLDQPCHADVLLEIANS